MTLEELTHTLPWGLHDAYLEKLEVDWINSRLSLTVRLMMTKHQDMDQRARIDVTGLTFVTMSPPTTPPDPECSRDDGGVWINGGPGRLNEKTSQDLPSVPDGCFLHYIYLQNHWTTIYLCGRDATLTWLDPAPVPARAGTRAAFPGDEIPL